MRVKKFRLKMIIFAYLGSTLAIPINFWEYIMVSFPRKQTVEGMLVLNVTSIGQEITSVDPLIFQSVTKMPYRIIYLSLNGNPCMEQMELEVFSRSHPSL